MRLFLAVDVDESTRRLVSAWRNRIVTAHGSGSRALRWVRPEQLHLTLRFLGDAVEATRVATALSAPLNVPSFSIAWGRVGWFPPRGRPRVLHVGVGDGMDGLLATFHALAERLDVLGVPAESRPFTPHLTVARVRDGMATLLGRLQEGVASLPTGLEGVRVEVSRVTLYDSQLSSAGPSYRVCHQIALS